MWNERLGYILTCPSNLGTGLRAGVHIKLPLLSKVVTMAGFVGSEPGAVASLSCQHREPSLVGRCRTAREQPRTSFWLTRAVKHTRGRTCVLSWVCSGQGPQTGLCKVWEGCPGEQSAAVPWLPCCWLH